MTAIIIDCLHYIYCKQFNNLGLSSQQFLIAASSLFFAMGIAANQITVTLCYAG